MGDVLQGRSDNRYKPSKLRNMSSEYDNPVSTAALLAAGASSMMVVSGDPTPSCCLCFCVCLCMCVNLHSC